MPNRINFLKSTPCKVGSGAKTRSRRIVDEPSSGNPYCMDVAGRAALVVEVFSNVVIIASGSGDDIVAAGTSAKKTLTLEFFSEGRSRYRRCARQGLQLNREVAVVPARDAPCYGHGDKYRRRNEDPAPGQDR